MAFTTVFRDACSLYAAGDVLKRYTSGGIGGMIASPDHGTAFTSPLNLKRAGLPAAAAYLVGVKFRANVLNGSLFVIAEPGGDLGQLGTNPSGHLTVHRGSTLIAEDAVSPISVGTWYTAWLGYLISDTVGRIQVVLDGTTRPLLTSTALGGTVSDSLDTKPGTATQFTDLIIARAPQMLVDIDWIIVRSNTAGTVWNPTVGAANDIWGNVFKRTLRGKQGAAGNGNYTAGSGWAIGAGGSFHSDVLRETTFDGNPSHIVRATVAGTDADRDSIKLDPMPSNTGSVVHLAHSWVTRREPAGSTVRHKGGIYTPSVSPFLFEDSAEQTDTDDYTVYSTGYDLHPGGGAWTKARVDETEPTIRATAVS